MNRINIDSLKTEYLGKIFGSLEVLDVLRNDNNLVVFRCRCACGNIKDVPHRRVIHGATKSCGCRSSTVKRLDVEKLKQEYIGKQINWLTIEDIFRDSTSGIVLFKCKCKCGNIKDISKKTLFSKCAPISCGCYKCSGEKSIAKKQYYADHPECILKLSEKRKQWAKENPEKCKAVGKHNSELYNKDPSRRLAVGERISNWFKYDKEGVQAWIDKRKQFYKDHPEIGEARSQLYKDKPEIVELIAEKNREHNKNNPEKVTQTNQKNREIAKEKRDLFFDVYKNCPIENRKYIDNKFINSHRDRRLKYNVDCLLGVIHPDYIDALRTGNITSYDTIETRCPTCNKYAQHVFHNVLSFGKGTFKNNVPPLCKECKAKQMSSKYEQEIADCISTFYNGECIKNDRTILNGKELDLYYPEKKIAIEFNGDYWHDENHKPREYHYNKFKQCLDKNLLLVSIFESEWINRKEVIVEYIRDLFNNRNNSITFETDGYMNNNYPSFECSIDSSYFKEDFYTVDNVKVYTCGYSKIN